MPNEQPPGEFWNCLQLPPLLKQCRICGAELEWNPYLEQWEDAEGVMPGRHQCTPEAIRAFVGNVHECVCGSIVLVYADGRRLNADKTPHHCHAKPERAQEEPRRVTKPRPARKTAVALGAVEI